MNEFEEELRRLAKLRESGFAGAPYALPEDDGSASRESEFDDEFDKQTRRATVAATEWGGAPRIMPGDEVKAALRYDRATPGPVTPRNDEELAAARAADTEGGFRRGVTGAASNFINTLTRGQAPGARQAPAESRVRELLAQRAQQREADMAGRRLGLDETRASNEAARTKVYADSVAAQGTRAESSAETQAKRLALDEKRVDISEREFDIKRMVAERKVKGGGPKRMEGLAPGWEVQADARPSKMQVAEHSKLVASTEKMRGLAEEMRRELASASTAERLNPMSEKYGALKQLATQIAIEGKNIAELGALSGPDYALMNAVATDPTKLTSMFRDMGKVLDGLERWGDNSVEAKAKAIGVRRQSSGAPSPTAPAASAPSAEGGAGGMVTVVDAEGDEIDLPRKDAEVLVKAGEARFK